MTADVSEITLKKKKWIKDIFIYNDMGGKVKCTVFIDETHTIRVFVQPKTAKGVGGVATISPQRETNAKPDEEPTRDADL